MKNAVAHIGGIFIYSEKAKELADWYKEIFGIQFEGTPDGNTNYVSYEYLDTESQKKYCTAFSILQSKNRPKLDFNSFCLNLRINDLATFCNFLKTKNIEAKAIEEYPEGKFSQMRDPENNLIELWEDTSV